MARRLLDTLLFASQGISGNVYYNDGAGTTTGRSIDVEWRGPNNAPSSAPSAAYSEFTGQRGGQPGHPLLLPVCEGPDSVQVDPSSYFPFATITVVQGASMCAAPTVVCDLAVTGSVTGVKVTIAVTTSHGPWGASLDGVGFAEGRTTFDRQFGERGTITVRDAANCRRTYDYVIPEPGNPKPAGVLTDYFNYGNGSSDDTRVEVYVLQNEPFTIAAWSPRNLPLPGLLSAAQRGRADGTALPPRCGGVSGTTQVRPYVTLEAPWLRIELTENAPGCGYVPALPPSGNFRFDYVLGTAESVKGSDGVIQAAVLGNDGPVLFSLDNYQTTGQTSGTFQGLRAGVYTVFARETRSQGRTISQQVTLEEPPHGLRYRVPVKSRGQAACVVNLYLRGYLGEPETLRSNGVTVDWAAGNASGHFFDQLICGSEGQVTIKALAGNDLADLDLLDERQLRLELVREGVLYWAGWVLPDLYEEPFLPRPHDIQVRATDGLGALKDVPLADGLGNPFTGEMTHWQLLRTILAKLTLPLPWAVLHTRYPDGVAVDASTEPLKLVSCDVAGFTDSDGKPWTCEKVLQSLLDYHSMRLRQWQGGWYLERLAELSTDQLQPRRYDALGAPVASPAPYSLLRVAEYQGPLHWQEARQLLSRHPAVASVTVTAEPGEARNYFPSPTFPATDFAAAGSGQLLAGWQGSLGARRAPDVNDVGKPAGLLLLAGQGETLTSPPIHLPAAGWLLDAGPLGPHTDFRSFRCTLTFAAQPAPESGFTSDPGQLQADFRLGFGYLFNGAPIWLTPLELSNLAGGFDLDAFPVYAVNGTGKAAASFSFALTGVAPGFDLVVRLHGSSKGRITLSDFHLTIGSATNGSYVNVSQGATNAGPRLTKRDTTLTLQLADTLNPDERVFSVLARSVLLAATGGAVALWREGLNPTTPAYYGIDLLVRDRLTWQQRPCWVLRGVLRGNYCPGALLVDPVFDLQTAFVTTAAAWDVVADTWDLTAVQALGIAVPLPEVPYCFLAEDGTPLLAENETYLLAPEDAY